MIRRVRKPEPFEVTRRDGSREWLEERFAALPELDVRRLFSGFGLYSADVIFGIYFRGNLYFKVDDASARDFLAKGAEPFCPRPGQKLGRYYEVPPEVADDDDELITWARRAIVAAQTPTPRAPRARAGKKKKKTAKKRRAKRERLA